VWDCLYQPKKTISWCRVFLRSEWAEQVPVVMVLPNYVWQVRGSNIARDTDYPYCPQSFQTFLDSAMTAALKIPARSIIHSSL
jgi:hypothetical protein